MDDEDEDEDSVDETLPVALESRPSLGAVLLTSSTVILDLDLGWRLGSEMQENCTGWEVSSYKGKLSDTILRPSITPFRGRILC